jgi:UDP-N-acetylglucosamine 2-epimerase (non-hydrolysing)
MIEFERVLQELKPDWVVVVGDVNATLACSVTAKKEHINCCHIEAGLRSGDIRMPEEVNRLVTDRLSDLLLTPDRISSQNLINEGVPLHKIKFVGNIMIDTLEKQKEEAAQYRIEDIVKKNSVLSSNNNLHTIQNKAFAVVTLHRPSNVDKKEVLAPIVHFLSDEVTTELPIIWTVHPRTRKLLAEFGLIEKLEKHGQIILLEPIGYHQMLCLNMNARIVMTDSGGLQEECTVLGTPCLTLRWNTERPITLKEHGGASYLVGNNIEKIRSGFREAMNKERKPVRPDLWDGKTAGRCLEAILNYEP